MTTANADDTHLPSNWGRWGTDDQAGTLNLITDQARARVVAQVHLGRSVSLAMPVEPAPMLGGPLAPPTPESPAVQQALLYTGSPPPAMAEILVFGPHHRGADPPRRARARTGRRARLPGTPVGRGSDFGRGPARLDRGVR